MSTNKFKFTVLTVAALSGGTAFAEGGDKNWYVHAGVGQLDLADQASFYGDGAYLTGATLATDPQTTPLVEIGRYFDSHDKFSVAVTLGLPPTAEADAAGTIAGLGRLTDVTYGPSALTLKYHPNRGGRISPYVGFGVSYMLIFDTEDALLTEVEVDNDIGPVIQAGATFKLTDKWDLFVDVKKAYLRTTATGNLGPQAIVADITMDPLVVSAGVGFKF